MVLQQALADLNAAYRNFFASITGKRKGAKVGPPRFKSRKDRRQTVRFTANARFKILANGPLRLPGVGDIQVRWSRDLPSDPSSVTVIKDAAGRYFASFVVETDPSADIARFPARDSQVGIAGGTAAGSARSAGVPSTQPCSGCGVSGGHKPLHVRQWRCTACGAIHDRDLNAAKNILALGLRERLNACGDDVRPPLAVAAVRETGTLRGAA